MKTHFVFVIQSYEAEMPNGNLVGYTELQLIDKNQENAMKRAKKLVKSNFYRLSTIIEKEN